MKVLVTGGTGFVGTNMVMALSRDDFNVVVVDSLSRRGADKNLEYLRSQFPAVNYHCCEIEDMASLIYRERPQLVFHFAAQVAVTSSVASPFRDFKINAEGSFLIARAAADVGAKVIYTSTNKVYGDNVNKFAIEEYETRYDFAGDRHQRGIDENVSIDANHHTPYGISKLVGEFYVREFGGIANRCSCMYGPNQFGIVDQGWLSHIATNKITGRETMIYGDGKQVRDALHIRDVVELLCAEIEALTSSRSSEFGGRTFNIGGGYENTISLLELCSKWGIQPRFGDWRPADQKVFYCNISSAREAFGWSPKVSLAEGLDELFAWTEKSCY